MLAQEPLGICECSLRPRKRSLLRRNLRGQPMSFCASRRDVCNQRIVLRRSLEGERLEFSAPRNVLT